ncbi:MAG: MFS transporter [Candidatus Dadabacteria bacterium]|nr:MAG: MFS transporter [Candidatus Dadabacteria bacterium]
MSKYRTHPVDTDGWPPGIGHIVANEAAERFSYYGMRAILVIFMTTQLRDATGQLAPMDEAEAKAWYHTFASAVYFFPLLGAILADAWLGKYRTIIALSLVYCAGHLALAIDTTRTGLLIGLALIAVGAGGIKPCVSAHVGDQFGRRNAHLLSQAFGWFYFAINLGAFASMLLTPILLDQFGPHVAFGVPGLLMFVATVVFWSGRHRFAHVPAGGRAFVREVFSSDGLGALGRMFVVFAFVAMFWALFDQTGSTWVLQAERMDRRFLGIDWLSAQIQAVNPILILVLIPVFNRWLYPAIERVFPLNPLRKIGLGFAVAVLAFLLPAWVEVRLLAGASVNIGWQLLSYVLMTSAEVMVSITCLELAYTQAPNRMKSVVMACFLLSVSAGNLLVAAFNAFVRLPDGSPRFAGASEYLFWAAAMSATTLLYIPIARRLRLKTWIQDAPHP